MICLKFLYLFITVFSLGTSVPVFHINPITNESYITIETTEDGLPDTIPEANISDIKIFFHSKNTDSKGIEIDLTDINTLDTTDYSNKKESIFLVHGWHSHHTSLINTILQEAYFAVQDVNIFVVDWSKISDHFYNVAQGNVEAVGKIVGEFVKSLSEKKGLNYNKTMSIGHSLGAHIAGVIGAATGGEINRVVGLDPAGPSFTMDNKDNRIDPSDGKFVQIIHTNAGTLGWNESLGHTDYWPNGGGWQPGCGYYDIGCDHGRVLYYFAESIKTGNFIAKSCHNWQTYQDGDCDNGAASYLGQYDLDTSASGDYYLETNDKSPFAKG